MSQVLNIPLDAIDKSEIALRDVNQETAEFKQLVASIRDNGVISAISVREVTDESTGETKYVIIDGLHRYTASVVAGRDEIPAQVIEADEAKVLSLQLQANLNVIKTKPAEYGKHIRRMLSLNPAMNMTDLARELNVSVSFIQQRLQLRSLIKEIQDEVDDGNITLSNALPLSKLPPEEQPNWVERAITQDPVEFVEACNTRVKEIRDAIRKGKKPGDESFTPNARLRKRSVIEEELDNPSVASELCDNNDQVEGWHRALQWAMHLDDPTVAEEKEKWEARVAKQKEDKERRDQERKARQAEKAREKAAKLEAEARGETVEEEAATT